MATINLTNGDDVYSTPLGEVSVDALGGIDRLTINYSSLTGPIRYGSSYGWGTYTDDAFNTISFSNFESYNITGGAESDDLRGGNSADILKGSGGHDLLYSGLGADALDGGTGTDTWIVDYSSIGTNTAITLLGAGATFTVAATGATVKNVEALNIVTGVGNDTINTSAMSGNDSITTGVGDDVIYSGRGFDSVNAGDGRDLLVLNYSTRTIDIFRTDLGYGWYRYQDGEAPTTSVDYYGVDRFNITGGSGNDTLYGGYDNDSLAGGGGNDVLNGYGGVDTINGGDGTDTWIFDYNSVLANISVNISTATQTTNTGAVISNLEQLNATTGIGADIITCKGGVFNDSISTGAGNDLITVGRGKDWLNAGDGDDRLVMNWSAATTPVTWSDQGYGWYRFTSGDGDQLDFYGVDRFNLTGGAGNDVLKSFGGTDTLKGGAGDDRLDSGAGNATIDGGDGTDYWIADTSANLAAVIINATTGQTTAQGGTGTGLSILDVEGFQLTTGAGNDNINNSAYATNDTVNTGAGNDTVFLGKGFDVTNGGDGTDTLTLDYSAMTSAVTKTDLGYGWYKYGDKLGTASVQFYGYEKFKLTGGSAGDNLIGGSNNDVLTGNNGNDTLNGIAGIDTIAGGLGNDRWIADYGGATSSLNLTLTSAGAGTLVGMGTTLTGIENITLTTGLANDKINTSAIRGNDVVNSGAGNDSVNLGAGRDVTNGGDGNDLLTFNFATSTSTVRLTDEGYGWYHFDDTAGLNSVRFYDFEQFNITTGSGSDRISTWGGDDIIKTGAGNDVITANAGDDILTGGAGNDIFTYATYGNGVDTITDAATGDTIRINGLALMGSVMAGDGTTVTTGLVQLSVNNTTNVSTLYIGSDGTAGADVTINLTGTYATTAFTLSGRDILLTAGSTNPGTAGNDILIGTSGNDELSGGLGNDSLDGKAGDDILNGGDGIDTLIGGTGADSLTGGLGADIFDYNTIWDSTAGTLFHDVINDFNVAQGDKIDLSTIDANPVLAGNQAFTFITTDFTGISGQVRYSGGLIQADVNGDGLRDIEIQLAGSPVIGAGNFIL